MAYIYECYEDINMETTLIVDNKVKLRYYFKIINSVFGLKLDSFVSNIEFIYYNSLK